MRNKAQTAMEYLMTYGWAILIIIVVVAALYAMGVFKIGAGTKCSPCFPSGGDMTYMDHTATDLALRAGPRDIRIPDSAGTLYTASSDITLTGGVQTYADAGETCATSTTWTGACKITIPYHVVETGLDHTVAATLHR